MKLILSILLAAHAALAFAADENPAAAADREAMLASLRRELAAMDTAIQHAPNDYALHSRRGDLHLFLGRFPEAVADFEKMIAVDPAQDASHWRLGIACCLAGQFAKSARQFEKYHAYDGTDRENGIWKFYAQVKGEGMEKARSEMLAYTRFDREPFPILYDMFAGRKTASDVLAHVEEKKLTADSRVLFFAHYYIGLNEELQGRRESAAEHLRKAVGLFDSKTSESGGPGYMWQVARVQLGQLEAAKP